MNSTTWRMSTSSEENETLDGKLSLEDAFGGVRPQDYPKDKIGDWKYFVNHAFDLERNQNPNFVRDNLLPPLRSEEHSGDGVEATWIVYGLMLGEQKCSILRVIVKPGVTARMNFDSPTFFFTEAGQGRVGGLEVAMAPEIQLGKIYSENGFVTEQARQDLKITNSGKDKLCAYLRLRSRCAQNHPGIIRQEVPDLSNEVLGED